APRNTCGAAKWDAKSFARSWPWPGPWGGVLSRSSSLHNEQVREFSEFAELCRRLAATPGRLDKRRLTADYLRALEPGDVGPAVDFLTGRAFPATDPRALNVRGLPPAPPEPIGPPLTLGDVASAFADVAATSGAGARRARDERLAARAAC